VGLGAAAADAGLDELRDAAEAELTDAELLLGDLPSTHAEQGAGRSQIAACINTGSAYARTQVHATELLISCWAASKAACRRRCKEPATQM
jgi:hypothetical protein